MTGFSRYIIVSSLPENLSQKDFMALCVEFGPIRNCRLQKSEVGTLSGFCEFELSDSATLAVHSINSRSQKDGSHLRASFSSSKFRLPMNKTCHIRVKYLPKNITQEEVAAEFNRFGAITRCKLVTYEANCTAHISYDSMESADLARHTMSGQSWPDPNGDRLLIEFNSAYHQNGRKSNSHHEEMVDAQPFMQQQQQAPQEENPAALYQSNTQQFYNFVQPYPANQVVDLAQEFPNQQAKTAPAQYVQFNPYCWPTNYQPQQSTGMMYESAAAPHSNGNAANSPPVKSNAQETSNPQWAQFYAQLVQQMQNTHLYQANAAAAASQYAQQGGQFATMQQNAAMLLNPQQQSLYCATALSPTPHNYSLFLNPAAAAAGNGYFRGVQQQLSQAAAAAAVGGGGFRYGAGQLRPAMGYQMAKSHGGGAAAGGGGGGPVRGNSNNTLYVYNTGNAMTEDGLRALFSRFGTIMDVSVPRDPTTGASRNFGFVNYLEPGSARLAIEQMNGFLFYDRVLQVSYKRARVSTNTRGQGQGQGQAQGANNNHTNQQQQQQQQVREKKESGSTKEAAAQEPVAAEEKHSSCSSADDAKPQDSAENNE